MHMPLKQQSGGTAQNLLNLSTTHVSGQLQALYVLLCVSNGQLSAISYYTALSSESLLIHLQY
jgi:hypothetical protein